MERIISILLLASADKLAQGKPINNGFTVKFNPLLAKEDLRPKSFGALFARIPQESSEEILKRDFFSKVFFPSSSELGMGCSNQIARILLPSKRANLTNTSETYENFINIPIIPQPFPDYKIIVATAPWNVKITGDEAKPAVVYIVFPEDDGDSKSLSVPTIYFVRKSDGFLDILNKKNKIDPLIIVDSNRTVTGLKSNEVPKFVRFKSKLTKSDKYEVTR